MRPTRLIETTRTGTTVEPIYNGVNDRVGQTVGLSTTNYALDVAAGLPEVIYTTDGNAYLHPARRDYGRERRGRRALLAVRWSRLGAPGGR